MQLVQEQYDQEDRRSPMSTSSEDYAHTAKENQTFFDQNEVSNYS
jgi:hypothetical protein